MSSAQILADFSQFLTNQGLSLKTCRNYRSDVGRFLSQAEVSFTQLNPHHFTEYKQQLSSSRFPLSTLNRHLSALRQFGNFLHQVHHLPNPTLILANVELPLIPTVIKNFRSHLVKNRYKHKTIANYLSDIRHYLDWAESRLN